MVSKINTEFIPNIESSLISILTELSEEERKKLLLSIYINTYFNREIIDRLKSIEVFRTLYMNVEIHNIHVELPVIIEKEEDGMFFAFIPDLDIGSQGQNVIDAYENCKDAIYLYFEDETDNFINEKLKIFKTNVVKK